MNKAETKPPKSNESLTDLLAQLATDSATFVREEVALAKQEFKEKMQALSAGAIMIAIGAVIALFAALTLWAALIIWLATFFPPASVAAIAGIILVILGAIVLLVGIKSIKKTTAEPIRTVEALQGRTGND